MEGVQDTKHALSEHVHVMNNVLFHPKKCNVNLVKIANWHD
jgi:hypothetical protein